MVCDIQKPDSKDSSKSDFLSSWKLKLPEKEGRHSTHNEILDNAHDRGSYQVSRLIEAMVVYAPSIEVSCKSNQVQRANRLFVCQRPLDIHLVPIGVYWPAREEKRNKEGNHVRNDKSNTCTNSKSEASRHCSIRHSSVKQQN